MSAKYYHPKKSDGFFAFAGDKKRK